MDRSFPVLVGADRDRPAGYLPIPAGRGELWITAGRFAKRPYQKKHDRPAGYPVVPQRHHPPIDLHALLLYNGGMNFWTAWKTRARALKLQALTLYYAYHHPAVPWYAKAFSALVVAYAFSPIDLIPDFIPVLGYLDDLLLIPLGVYLAFKMIPPAALEESKLKAKQNLDQGRPVFQFMAVVIIVLWIVIIALAGLAIYRAARGA